MTIIPRLPKTSTDGTEIIDKYGDRYDFHAGEDAWVFLGSISDPGVVTEDLDGIISAEIFRKLQYLKATLQINPGQFDKLKILPGLDAYWYYFRTSDKLFRFTPEGDGNLRIEIDRGRLYQLIYKVVCPGPDGPPGDAGDQGPPGKVPPAELCYDPTIDGSRLDFSIFVPVPLTTPISVRVFQTDQVQIASAQTQPQADALAKVYKQAGLHALAKAVVTAKTVLADQSVTGGTSLCGIPLSPSFKSNLPITAKPTVTVEIDPNNPTPSGITFPNSLVEIDGLRTANSIKWDPALTIICGSIYLANGANWFQISEAQWCVKARQKGPPGDKGDPGTCGLEIINETIDSTNIVATCPIINLRYDPERDVLYELCSNLLASACYNLLQFAPNGASLASTDAMHSTFAAAQVTLDTCKAVYKWQADLQTDTTPELDLVHWMPQPGCVSKRNYDRHNFNWIPSTDNPACNNVVQWYSPDSLRPTLFPGTIVTAPKPEVDECCQDDFFYCPNIQDAPCGNTPPPPPPPSPIKRAAARSMSVHDPSGRRGGDLGTFNFGAKDWRVRS